MASLQESRLTFGRIPVPLLAENSASGLGESGVFDEGTTATF
jgi:hypothetical protein